MDHFTDGELAAELGVTRNTALKWRHAGMPNTSIELAKAWVLANQQRPGPKTAKQDATVEAPDFVEPEASDPYAIRDRLRLSERQISAQLDGWTNVTLPTLLAERNKAEGAEETKAIERKIHEVNYTVRGLRLEQRQAAKNLMDVELRVTQLEKFRGQLIDIDVAKNLVSRCVQPLLIYIRGIPDLAENQQEKAKLENITVAADTIFYEASHKALQDHRKILS